MIKDFCLPNPVDTYLLRGEGDFTINDSCHMDKVYDVCSYMHCYYSDDDDIQYETPHPFALMAKARNDDTPTYTEAMESPDREGFITAMQDEYDSLLDLDTWNVVPRSTPIKSKKRIFNSTWAFKRKRYPDGLV